MTLKGNPLGYVSTITQLLGYYAILADIVFTIRTVQHPNAGRKLQQLIVRNLCSPTLKNNIFILHQSDVLKRLETELEQWNKKLNKK